MASVFDGSGIARMIGDLDLMAQADPMPLMLDWEQHIIEGNRRGVLSGVDGNDQPMPPLKYRNGAGKRTANRRVPHYGTPARTTPVVAGIAGPYAPGFDQNLTTAEYRLLTGPRLAPRREESRVITALHTEIRHEPGSHRWEVVGAWDSVVSRKGVKFLRFHFEGAGHLPKYDLTPVRPRDRQFCLNALDAFIRQVFFERF